MTLQLSRNFHASQAVHGADDVTTLHFKSQVNALSVCGPQVKNLIYDRRLGAPPYSVNFGWKVMGLNPSAFKIASSNCVCLVVSIV